MSLLIYYIGKIIIETFINSKYYYIGHNTWLIIKNELIYIHKVINKSVNIYEYIFVVKIDRYVDVYYNYNKLFFTNET